MGLGFDDVFVWVNSRPRMRECNDAFDHGSDFSHRIASLLRDRFVFRRLSMVSLGNRYNESSRSRRSISMKNSTKLGIGTMEK